MIKSKIATSIISRYREWHQKKTYKKHYCSAQKFLQRNPQPELTSQEKREIDEYWAKYNIRYPDYTWYQMFYGVTGIHDPRFIPDTLVGYVLYPYYNKKTYVKGWDDKNVYELLVPNARFPHSICHCVKGQLYDHDWNYIENKQKFSLSVFEQIKGSEVVVKQSSDTLQGKGVRKIAVTSQSDILNLLENVEDANFLIQEKIQQHDFFNQFNKTSVNIIRIITWRHEGVVNVLSASVRYGIEGAFTDVSFVNGEEVVNVCGITKDGVINDRFVDLQGISRKHPNIGEKKIPSWDLLIKSVKAAHQNLLFFDLVGWDYVIDYEGTPICIEYNIDWPGTTLYQFANGIFAGNLSDKMLEPLKQSKIIIPKFFINS